MKRRKFSFAKLQKRTIEIYQEIRERVEHRNDYRSPYYNDETGEWEIEPETPLFPFALNITINTLKCEMRGWHDVFIESSGDAESGPITYAECKCCGKSWGPIYGM